MIDRLKAIPILLTLFLVNTIFRFVSVKTVWNLGECLGTLCYRMMPKRRAVIDFNMKVVASSTQGFTPTPELTESIFQRNIANLSCTLKTYGMTPHQLADYIDINVSPSFHQAVKDNTGAILCLAHMGNWEILSKLMLLVEPKPERFGAIYRPLDSKAADDYVANQRKEYNCEMFPKSTPLGTLSTFIRDGGVMGILADQRSGRPKKANRPFFGRDSARSKLPAVLHLRTGAPLFTLSVHSPTPGRWTIDILPINLPDKKLSTDEIVENITAGYERNFSAHLLDVFWLHSYWVK
jgi:KDO2-lipid IV(A) lauroyltransferase